MARLIILFAGLALTACTQDFNVFVGDASSSGDAPGDSPASGDASVDAPPSGDGGLTFQCSGGGNVSDCSQCSGAPIPCVYCSQTSSLAGRCIQQGGSCFQGAPSGYFLCQCQNASTCPESYQVCRNGSCRTCADSTNNNGLTCKGGGTCDAFDGGCL